MTPDLILSNPPYGKIGVDITKQLMENHNDSQMAILGTKSMFNKYYNQIALEYVQVGEYQYDPKGGKTRKMDWNVSQAILLGWHRKGSTWTEVVPKRTLYGGGCIRLHSKRASSIDIKYATCVGSAGQIGIEKRFRTKNVPVYVGTAPGPIDFGGTTNVRTNHVCTVELPKSEPGNKEKCESRTFQLCNECELPHIEHIKWVKEMNPNYVWMLFDTLEDAVSAAVYLGSWETPSDSHNRLKELGFIDTFIPHEE